MRRESDPIGRRGTRVIQSVPIKAAMRGLEPYARAMEG
jgi:hypothetical protein